jgi:hypothetical protein
MMENELVKANDVVAELDSVLELEDDVDGLPVEESVLCCALAPSAAKHCSHINARRMALGEKTGASCWMYRQAMERLATKAKNMNPSVCHSRQTRMCTYTWVSSCMAAIPRRHR